MKWVGISVRTHLLPWTAAIILALGVGVGGTFGAATHVAGHANPSAASAAAGLIGSPSLSGLEADADFSDLLHPAPLATARGTTGTRTDPEAVPAPEPTSLS